MADSYLGKVKTIIYFSLAYMFGLLILFFTSLPIAIESGYAFGGLITAMILIGMFVLYYFYPHFTSMLKSAEAQAASNQTSPHSLQSNIQGQNKAFGSSPQASA